ncbi:MAG: STAS domain-containing protein [Actinomycetota bacterium]|nr:STAS domain-containing protein [Actinomycetota bacterium]
MARREGTTLRLSVAGELDRASTGRVERALDDALEARTDHIVVDLSAVTFLDLAAIRTLLSANARTRDQGQDLTVVRPSGTASRIFTLTRVGEVLALSDPGPSAATSG